MTDPTVAPDPTPCVAGFVGVGNMGGAMAANLLERGWTVWVHDIDRRRAGRLAQEGALLADDAAELARHADVIVVAVVDAEQTREVLFGAQGLARSAQGTRKTVLLCPTIAPSNVERFGAGLADCGFDAIDAPMSGGPLRARDGSMSLMVACPRALFQRHLTLLQTLASRLFHVGERLGDGARTKLVNNLLAGVNLAGAAEALALAQRIGLDPLATLGVIEQSSGQSWIGSDRLRRVLARDQETHAHIGLLAKDTGLALELAQSAGLASPLGAAAHAVFASACQDGLGHVDDGALYRLKQQGLPTIES